jgi:hypothetical protein
MRSKLPRRPSKSLHRNHPRKSPQILSPIDHAVRVIHHFCCLAGPATLIEDLRKEHAAAGIRSAIGRRDTARLFDCLMHALSFQGISDQVASDYMRRHGLVTWADIDRGLRSGCTCPKLKSYWHFHGCRFDKLSRTCAEPDHIDQCPLPTHDLRNGRLNQMAYSLFLFIRDIAAGDLTGWIDSRISDAGQMDAPSHAAIRESLLDPLRHVYGLSDKVLSMALACLLIGAPKGRPHWVEVGASMIAIDTLVHNFLHRTGILRRFHAEHSYGVACYQPSGCADIIETVAGRIDAQAFNKRFPRTFPRFVQAAVWRYCAQRAFDVCNGNRIDDRKSCNNSYCQIRSICDRNRLHNQDHDQY